MLAILIATRVGRRRCSASATQGGGKGNKNHASVNAKHFRRGDLYFKGDYTISAAYEARPYREHQWDRYYQLDSVTRVAPSNTGGIVKCICTLGDDEYGENIRFENGHKLPLNKKRSYPFVKRLVFDPKKVIEHNKQIDQADGYTGLMVHRRHFKFNHLATRQSHTILLLDAIPYFRINDYIQTPSVRRCPSERRETAGFVSRLHYSLSTNNGRPGHGDKRKITPLEAAKIFTPIFYEQRDRMREDMAEEQKVPEVAAIGDHSGACKPDALES
ncbi:hypothetical protein SARC_08451 [Sphaeroforma arctica JP610]|uniref:Uncharacterized protein n=1 Tax=Sphaeroforma arctica JP610 TaxID=667725 RepID=A0A0L0FT63_9EUKA|nr:hypothetical protein SARC_08451 [Sphaeroforma arctica JP610]KNC79143.1 hypothetical protein SARC_08451 [Sphaeroforma arctica JP610]|eukprot:XP_014153045.1 hypothetical protein SARC_08451 [Sphaeroforma arctica JP610]